MSPVLATLIYVIAVVVTAAFMFWALRGGKGGVS